MGRGARFGGFHEGTPQQWEAEASYTPSPLFTFLGGVERSMGRLRDREPLPSGLERVAGESAVHLQALKGALALVMASSKTNAARFLDRLGVAYDLLAYEVDETDLSAETVAAKVGMPSGQVFKTLVARGDRTGVLLAVVPADAELDGKALARATGDRRVETVALREVLPLTGHVRGGVTAIGLRRGYPVYLDESAYACERIAVSAGVRGLQIALSPSDYVGATAAIRAALARAKR